VLLGSGAGLEAALRTDLSVDVWWWVTAFNCPTRTSYFTAETSREERGKRGHDKIRYLLTLYLFTDIP
jgi:hypothetical protein